MTEEPGEKRREPAYKIHVAITVTAVLVVLAVCTHSCTNLWYLLTENGYFVPQESNIFCFNATKMNPGSGGWWIYGEDGKYWYALYQSGYLKLRKGNGPENFDKFNYRTWGESAEYRLAPQPGV
jgi:hypothetical protein